MELDHRLYLLSYHKHSFYGFWKSLLDNPPCKKPNYPRNKQFSYELEAIREVDKHILYLHLIGDPNDLDGVEKQLAKFKIARLEPPNQPDSLVLIVDRSPDSGATHIFREFSRSKGLVIKGREIHHADRVLKVQR